MRQHIYLLTIVLTVAWLANVGLACAEPSAESRPMSATLPGLSDLVVPPDLGQVSSVTEDDEPARYATILKDKYAQRRMDN